MTSSLFEDVDHVGHVVMVIHVAAMPAGGIDLGAVPEYTRKEIDLAGCQGTSTSG